jgi:light-regulated signal transduction histidine kinase (bacteriophytochrome)
VVCENLRAAIEETGARVTQDPLPVVLGSESQILQLFQNLMGNAIKFTPRGAVPEIHVGARREKNEWLFSVRDNGIGIDPRYQEKVFQIFQRLQSREEYPGTGIGLAICRKIVERHGGRIWVESQADRGSTFFFTLPETEAQDGRHGG